MRYFISVRGWAQSLFVVLTLGLAGTGGRASLLLSSEREYFKVEGLLAEDLTATSDREDKFFEAGIYQMPLVEPRPWTVTLEPPPAEPGGIELAPAGRAVEALRSAEAYAAAQDWKLALASIQTALDEDPSNLMLLRRAAAFAALARKFGAADEYFRRVLEQKPDDVAFLVGRAGILLRLARFREAENLANRALSIQPGYLAGRFVKSCIEISRGAETLSDQDWSALFTEQVAAVAQWLQADRADYEAVMTTNGFRKACDVMLGTGLADRVDEIARRLGKALFALQGKQWDVAKMELIELQHMGLRAVGIEMDIARCLFESGSQQQAERLLGALAARYPKLAVLRFNHAVALMRLARYADALVALEHALNLDPNSNYTLFTIACAYAGLGKMDEAWNYLQRIKPEYRSLAEEWAKGDDPYFKALREDPRFAEFVRSQAQ